MREVLVKLHNDMNNFNPEIPIVVTYDKETHIITYRQLNKLVMIPYMRPYYLSERSFKLGILSPTNYVELMTNIRKLLQESDLDKDGGSIAFSVDKLKIKVYKTYLSPYLIGPQVLMELKLVTISTKWLAVLIMRILSPETRTLLKLLKNERKHISKDSK